MSGLASGRDHAGCRLGDISVGMVTQGDSDAQGRIVSVHTGARTSQWTAQSGVITHGDEGRWTCLGKVTYYEEWKHTNIPVDSPVGCARTW